MKEVMSPRAPLNPFWKWMIFLLLALITQSFLIFLCRWILTSSTVWQKTQKLELKTLDAFTLEKIRKKLEKKQFLLHSSPSQSRPAPEASYLSDHNTRTQKEQRAAKTGSSLRSQSIKQPDISNLSRFALPFDWHQKSSFKQNKTLSKDVALQSPSATPPLSHSFDSDQWIEDKSLSVGNENLLNTQAFMYHSFYVRLHESIVPLWESYFHSLPHQLNLPSGEYETIVEAVLDSQGVLKTLHYLQRSGIPEFDRIVEKAWRKIAHYPNPPRGLLNEAQELHILCKLIIQVKDGNTIYGIPFLHQPHLNP